MEQRGRDAGAMWRTGATTVTRSATTCGIVTQQLKSESRPVAGYSARSANPSTRCARVSNVSLAIARIAAYRNPIRQDRSNSLGFVLLGCILWVGLSTGLNLLVRMVPEPSHPAVAPPRETCQLRLCVYLRAQLCRPDQQSLFQRPDDGKSRCLELILGHYN